MQKKKKKRHRPKMSIIFIVKLGFSKSDEQKNGLYFKNRSTFQDCFVDGMSSELTPSCAPL